MEDLVPVVTFNVAGRVVSIRYPPDGHGGTERLLGGFVAGPFPLQSGTTFHPFLASTHPAVPTLVPDGPGGRLLGTENQGRRGNAGSHQGPPPPLDPPNCLSAQCVFNALHHHCTSTLASVMYPCCCLTFGCSRPPFWHAWASLSFSLPPSLSPTNCDPPFRLYSRFLSFDSLFQPLGHCSRGTVSLGFVLATATRSLSFVPRHCASTKTCRSLRNNRTIPCAGTHRNKQTKLYQLAHGSCL